ncbi:unnamed protein product [Ectocarpus sp. 12 AP-2014]
MHRSGKVCRGELTFPAILSACLALYGGVPACWWRFLCFCPTSREGFFVPTNHARCCLWFSVVVYMECFIKNNKQCGMVSLYISFYHMGVAVLLSVFHVASLASACSWLFNRCLSSWYDR